MTDRYSDEYDKKHIYEPLTEEELAAVDAETEEERRISEYYTTRRLQKNQMERKVRKSQRALSRMRVLLRLLVILGLIFLGYKMLRMHQWYLDKNVFYSANNAALEISNNKIVPSYKILAELRKSTIPHTPIYRLETDEIKSNILALEPIDNVYIRRFWFPARLQIIVEEKQPVLTITPSETVPPIAFFAKDGTLIGREYMPLNKSFNTVLVVSYGSHGDDYRGWSLEKINLIQHVAKTVEESSGEKVEYVDFRIPKDIYVKIKTANLRLGELDDTVFERIKRIQSILPQVKMLDKPIKYIDLRWKNTNYIKLG